MSQGWCNVRGSALPEYEHDTQTAFALPECTESHAAGPWADKKKRQKVELNLFDHASRSLSKVDHASRSLSKVDHASRSLLATRSVSHRHQGPARKIALRD